MDHCNLLDLFAHSNFQFYCHVGWRRKICVVVSLSSTTASLTSFSWPPSIPKVVIGGGGGAEGERERDGGWAHRILSVKYPLLWKYCSQALGRPHGAQKLLFLNWFFQCGGLGYTYLQKVLLSLFGCTRDLLSEWRDLCCRGTLLIDCLSPAQRRVDVDDRLKHYICQRQQWLFRSHSSGFHGLLCKATMKESFLRTVGVFQTMRSIGRSLQSTQITSCILIPILLKYIFRSRRVEVPVA